MCPVLSVPVNGISPMMHFTSVDLPSPFLPTKATFSPRLMLRFTSESTVCSP